jgi:DnaK suppressor protein
MVDVPKIHAHIDAELSQAQLKELASLLADKRRELSERVVDLNEQVVIKDDCALADAADAASLQENRLRSRGIVEQHQQTINEIGAALRRLEVGSYGISETSGEPIAYNRLMLIPWARTGADDKE